MKNDGTFVYYRGKHLAERESVLAGFERITQLLLLSLEPSVSESKANDFTNTAKKWIKDARRYLTKIEQGKIPNPNIVTIQNGEISKLMRRASRAVKPLASRKSKDQQ
jgi:cell wall-associated NlpC family hydrolase